VTLDIWLLYVVTVLALMSTPGPSQLLMLSNSAAHGFQRSLLTAGGDLTANALQTLAAWFGVAALIVSSQYALTVIKWGGVLYLLWLGIRMIRKANITANDAGPAKTASLKSLWFQGFITSASNPKAIVFFAALFPQFIDATQPFWIQFFILSATYLIVDGIFLSTYGASAGWIASRLRGASRNWLDRAGGGFMIGAAILLGMKTLWKSG